MSRTHDTGLEQTPRSPTEFSQAQDVNSAAEVDAVMEQATRAGAKLLKPAQKTF